MSGCALTFQEHFFCRGNTGQNQCRTGRRVSDKYWADNDGKIDEPFLESIQDPEVRQAFKKLLRGDACCKK